MKMMIAIWMVLLSPTVWSQDEQIMIEHFAPQGAISWAAAVPKPEKSLRVVTEGAFPAWDRPQALLSELLQEGSLDAVGVGYLELANYKELGNVPTACVNVKEIARAPQVRQVGNLRVAFIGITKVPAYRQNAIPKGLTIEDPTVKLKEVLPALARRADLIVLLASMDRLECAELVKGFPEIAVALVTARGVNDPEPVQIGPTHLVQTPTGDTVVGRLMIKVSGKKVVSVSNAFERVMLSDKDLERLRAIFAKHGVTPNALVKGQPKPMDSKPAVTFEVGKLQPLAVTASNRAVEVEVHSLHLLRQYAGEQAPNGSVWLVLDQTWKNIIPMSIVFDRQVPTAYSIPKLSDPLYLVYNGTRVARVSDELSSRPGGLVEREFKLPNVGSTRRGKVVFLVPESGITSLELRFYDYAHGHILIPLMQRAQREETRPIAGPQSNGYVELALYASRKVKEFAGRKAQNGMTFLVTELRGHSLYTIDADATAFDPKAKKGDRIKIGTAFDWKEAHKNIHAIVDGEYAYQGTPEAQFAEGLLLVPDTMTGGEFAFLIPEKFECLELRFDFLKSGVPGLNEIKKPQPVVLPLEGKRGKLPERKALLTIADEGCKVELVGHSIVSEFGGEAAGKDNSFLVVDVTVHNDGQDDEFFPVKTRLEYVAEDGSKQPLDSASYKGPRYPSETVWIPKGERRTFQVVYRIRRSESKLRLAYNGASKAEIVNLTTGDSSSEQKQRACLKCKAKVDADDKFCTNCGAKIER